MPKQRFKGLLVLSVHRIGWWPVLMVLGNHVPSLYQHLFANPILIPGDSTALFGRSTNYVETVEGEDPMNPKSSIPQPSDTEDWIAFDRIHSELRTTTSDLQYGMMTNPRSILCTLISTILRGMWKMDPPNLLEIWALRHLTWTGLPSMMNCLFTILMRIPF